jgi:serine phosphatase RsbU (regulator of sigma subunit)
VGRAPFDRRPDLEGHELVAVPLHAGRAVLGVAVWALDRPRARSDDDVDFVELLAEQLVAGLTRARASSAQRSASESLRALDAELASSLAEQRHVATVLQNSLLPRALPEVPGFEVAAHYWAEGEGISVGGDFYDVVPLDRGRYALFVGDVCGKGVEAAATTATVRHTARAAAMHLSQPEAVLRWVHDAMAAQEADTFCTVAYAVLETTHPPFIDVALAGHPTGILVRPDGSAVDVGAPGTLLGTIAPTLRAARYALEAGDLVAFYTDGITDAPGSGAMDHAQLRAWLAAHAREPLQEIGTALHRELERRRPDGLSDDVALILLRATAASGGRRGG